MAGKETGAHIIEIMEACDANEQSAEGREKRRATMWSPTSYKARGVRGKCQIAL